MKTQWLLPVLMLSATTPALAEREGHGGDPIEISASEYSNPAQLKSAIQLAEDRISQSAFPDAFKKAMKAEIERIQSAGKYKMLPDLILLASSEGKNDPEAAGYPLPADSGTFISLGAMTDLEMGAPVYFAYRVADYSVDQVASLVTHEVAHHVAQEPLGENEEFITDLTAAITQHSTTQQLDRAFRDGVYFTGKQLRAKEFVEIYLNELRGWIGNRPDRDEIVDTDRELILSALPENLIDMPLSDLYSKVQAQVYKTNGIPSQMHVTRYTWIATFDDLTRRSNTGMEFIIFCRSEPSLLQKIFGGFECPAQDQVKVQDVLRK